MPTRRSFLEALVAGASAPALISGARAQEPAERASSVGSLTSFIQSQAVKGECPLSYLNSEFQDVNAWKKKARARFLDLLHYAPPRCEPKAEIVEKAEGDGFVREKVYFNTTPDIRVPAYVLIPVRATKPAPAVVLLHDHGGFYFWGKEKLVPLENEHPVLTRFRKEAYSGIGLAPELARQGYVVIVIDMFYWGERRMLLEGDAPDWRDRPASITAERIADFNRRASQGEELVARTIYSAGFTWSGVMFWDDIRTVDYLVSRPEVDRNRIACVGLSVGAIRSCHLAALDDRIKAAAVICWMTSFPTQLQTKIVHTIGFTKLVPGLYKEMDYPDVASLAIPTPLLVINGGRDQLFEPEGVRKAFDKLAACYRKAGVPDRIRTRLYDTPHEFNSRMQGEAWDWLRRWV